MVVAVDRPDFIDGILRAVRCDNQETPDHVDETTQKEADWADPQEDKSQVGVVILAAFRAVLSVNRCLSDEIDYGNQSDYHEDAMNYEENDDLISRHHQKVILLSRVLETFV